MGKRARRAGHAVTSRLVADVRDVTSTCSVACFTYILASHGTCKYCDHVIISYDNVIKWINS